MLCLISISGGMDIMVRIAAGVFGVWAIFYFFRSIIRVGLLHQRYKDPLAFWIGRIVLVLFMVRIGKSNREERNRLLSWYWPTAVIAIVASWFLLVMVAFALITWAVGAEATLPDAIVASGSALSTIGFSTPPHLPGRLLAIAEGAIGLFLVVYVFTFVPGFMELIHNRGERVSWVYARTGSTPSGVGLLLWFKRNRREENLQSVWENWETFFRDLSHARSFLPILTIIRPLDPRMSWVCAFGAFLDALAIASACLAGPKDSARICFGCGVVAVKNIREALSGSPLRPRNSPERMHVAREHFDSAMKAMREAGFEIEPDVDKAWRAFLECRVCYEEEIAWLAKFLDDPTPSWKIPADP